MTEISNCPFCSGKCIPSKNPLLKRILCIECSYKTPLVYNSMEDAIEAHNRVSQAVQFLKEVEIKSKKPISEIIKVSTFQPMETAPKDREILLYFPSLKAALPGKWEFQMWASDYPAYQREEDEAWYAWQLNEEFDWYGHGDGVVYLNDDECEKPAGWAEIPEKKP